MCASERNQRVRGQGVEDLRAAAIDMPQLFISDSWALAFEHGYPAKVAEGRNKQPAALRQQHAAGD